MTGIEFKNKVEEFRTNKNITVAEHDNMFRELKSVALKTIRKFLRKYDNYFMQKYEVEYIISAPEVYGVEFKEEGVTFLYWDDPCQETSSCLTIPIDDFSKWIDNDITDLHEFIIKDIVETLTKQVESDQKRIKYYQDSIEHTKQFLANIDKMKFNDIKKWYDEWIENSI